MNSKFKTLINFEPFPRNSVNLVTGPTNIGKSYFVSHFLNNYKVYFPLPVKRIFVVLCNDRVQPMQLDAVDVLVEQISLADFSPDALSSDDLVVIDDVQNVTDSIRMCISVCAHHYNLTSLFIITHSILGHKNFELLNLCHRVFLFTTAQGNGRLANYISANFFNDPESRAALKEILVFCQREMEIVGIELATKADNRSPLRILAVSHLTSLTKDQFCLVYPQPHSGMDYSNFFEDGVSVDHEISTPMDVSEMPNYTLVAVPAKAVSQKRLDVSTPEGSKKCSKQEEWESTNESIEEMIESFFKSNRWQDCKNLAAEILRNNSLCVYKDGRYFHMVGKPKTKVSMVDFLHNVTRRAGIGENTDSSQFKIYKQYVEVLRANDAPLTLFKNKLLKPAK